MDYTKESVQIKNSIADKPFRLEMDDIKGYIRLTKNQDTETTRITTRNIPISEGAKWNFHNQRDKYCEVSKGDEFNGSAIFRSIDEDKYKKWKDYMKRKYKELKEDEPLNSGYHQLTIFDIMGNN